MTWIYTLTADAIKGQFRFVFSVKEDMDIHAYCRCHQGSVQVCTVRMTWIYTVTVDAIKGQFRFVFSEKDMDIHAYCRCHQCLKFRFMYSEKDTAIHAYCRCHQGSVQVCVQ